MPLFHSLILLSWKSLEQVKRVPASKRVCRHIRIKSMGSTAIFIPKKGLQCMSYSETLMMQCMNTDMHNNCQSAFLIL